MRNPPRRLSPGDHMKMKPLTAALAAAGVLAAGSAGAFSLTPEWLKSKSDAKPVAVTSTAPAPVPMLSAAGQVPNYRAIVATSGPAVVGVTVAGLHKASAEEQQQQQGLPPGAENDPFFQFFRGLPGF